jgi:hypothetical protein
LALLKIEDTHARQNASAHGFAYSNFGFAQDTHARQNASELAFALAYSYLCHRFYVYSQTLLRPAGMFVGCCRQWPAQLDKPRPPMKFIGCSDLKRVRVFFRLQC